MDNQRSGFSNYMPPVTKNIIIINVLMWLACIVFEKANSSVDLLNLLGLHFFAAEGFKIFQTITYMFLHATLDINGNIQFGHIFFNMFAVYMFGRTVEYIWGSKQFLIYYIVTGIGAGLIQELVWLFTVPPQYYEFMLTVGASGAVFGILLAFGVMFPNAPLYIMFIPIPVKAKYVVIGYGIMELFMGVSNQAGDNVAHFAHLGGMLFGIILLLFWKKKGRLYGQRTR
jgi:Uncharacterized membrane protein (homolog of Drosophila rhomboid)